MAVAKHKAYPLGRSVLPGYHGANAGQCRRFAGVDRYDPGVRMRTPQYLAYEWRAPWGAHVGRVPRLASSFQPCIAPRNSLADHVRFLETFVNH
jgi:hypothetical protein